MNNPKSLHPALIPLGIGILLGLLCGLLIGWVLWPVEWTGASINELYPDAKAEYLAAVADAYAVYDSPEAAAIARRRLAALDADSLEQTFADAILYFRASNQDDRAIRISNLGRLANALNLTPPNSLPVTEEVAAQAAPTVAVATPVTLPDATSSGTSGMSWLRWLLWLLTALLLVGGGLYILTRVGLDNLREIFKSLTTSRTTSTSAVDEFEDDYDQRAAGAAATPRARPKDIHADYRFEEEDDEGDWPYPALNLDDDLEDERAATYYQAGGNGRRLALQDDFADEPDELDEDFADYDSLDSESDETDDAYAPFRPVISHMSIDVEPPAANVDPQSRLMLDQLEQRQREMNADEKRTIDIRQDALQESEPRHDEAETENESPAPQSRPTATLPSSRIPASRPATAQPAAPQRTRYKVIEQHTFRYHMGIEEYDESRPIVDVPSGRYIGEFGMGASTKNALVQAGPNQVVALEVWLFDKTDEKNLGHQTRILLSEYAVDHNLEQVFLKERNDNPRPFTAQPGVHFQLESQSLLLDCSIVEVEYSHQGAAKGVFQSIKVDMAVQQKR